MKLFLAIFYPCSLIVKSVFDCHLSGVMSVDLLILSTNVDKKTLEIEFFDCHLSSNWRQMAIKISVSSDFSLSVFVDC